MHRARRPWRRPNCRRIIPTVDEALQANLLAWCRSERERALPQTEFFTAQGAKLMVQQAGSPPQDITEQTIADYRRTVAEMERILADHLTH